MSAALLATLKFGFLALMWLFILFATNVIRTDLFGRRVSVAELSSETSPRPRTGPTSAAPARLAAISGRSAGSSATLPALGNEIFLGRSPQSDLVIDDDYASGQHAKIWRDVEGYVIEDLTSTNGTYVNDERITRPTRFGDGDEIRIGRTHLQMESR